MTHDLHRFAVRGHEGFAAHPAVAALCLIGLLLLVAIVAWYIGRRREHLQLAWNTEAARRAVLITAPQAELIERPAQMHYTPGPLGFQLALADE